MDFINEINCIGRDGQTRIFKYCLNKSEENGKTKWAFMIVPNNMQYTDCFEFEVTEVKEGIAKVTMMKHQGLTEYTAMGIPDKMIEEAHSVLNLIIISSSNKLGDGEYRTLSASKVWDRMVEKGCAEYEEDTDSYTYINP